MIFLTKTAKKADRLKTRNTVQSLRAADSYHLMEGRYFLAETVLKHKKRFRLAPSFIVAILAGVGLFSYPTNIQIQPDLLAYNPAAMTVLKTSKQPLTASVDYDTMTINQYEMRPVSADEESGKPSIYDSNPDEKRINIVGLGDKPGYEIANAPNIEDPQKQLLSVGYSVAAAIPSDQKILNPSLEKQQKLQLVASIVPPRKDVVKLPVPDQLKTLVTNNDPDVLALAFAPKQKTKSNPFDGVIRDQPPQGKRFIPPISKNDHEWAATALPATVFEAKQQKCLAEAIYFESRGESLEGQAAVAQVVLNRVRNPAYPNTICKVVYQNTNWLNKCQFSFACDGQKHFVTEMKQWKTAQEIARAVTAGQIWLPAVGSATHYHAVYVRPNWARTMVKVSKIGLHVFYRTIGGGWI